MNVNRGGCIWRHGVQGEKSMWLPGWKAWDCPWPSLHQKSPLFTALIHQAGSYFTMGAIAKGWRTRALAITKPNLFVFFGGKLHAFPWPYFFAIFYVPGLPVRCVAQRTFVAKPTGAPRIGSACLYHNSSRLAFKNMGHFHPFGIFHWVRFVLLRS